MLYRLSIASGIVNMMGGKIRVESEEGVGSTFHFTTRFAYGQRAARPPKIPSTDLPGLRVLVVDDNETNRRILDGFLGRMKMDTVCVASGVEALRTLDQAHRSGEPMDMAILDVHMPEMDGFELAKQIRKDDRFGDLVLVTITSAGRPGDGALWACTPGVKQNAKGYRTHWVGYKVHIDVADGDIPVSAIVTSASLHDSQVAIPLATMTAARLTNLYDVMDSAYNAPEIEAHSRALGHVPLIAPHPRTAAGKRELKAEAKRQKRIGLRLAEQLRYQQRAAAERVIANFKDNFAGRVIRVRGPDKVACHIMFSLTALAAIQIVRLVQ